MNQRFSWNRRVWPILALVAITVLALAGVILAGNEDNDGVSSTAAALGPGFVFQGQLADDGGAPLDGACDLRFGLYDDALDGSKLGEAIRNAVPVVSGVFSRPIWPLTPSCFPATRAGCKWRCAAQPERGTFVSLPIAMSYRPCPMPSVCGPAREFKGLFLTERQPKRD